MRFELRLHGRKAAALEIPDNVPLWMARKAAHRAYDDGQDVAFQEIGQLILDLGKAGRTDSEIILAVDDLIMLRMMAGLPDAAAQLAEGETS